MLAAQFGHTELVSRLLGAGAPVDDSGTYAQLGLKRLKTGLTSLILAAQNGHAEAARLLLAGGASLTAQAERGDTALHMAAQQGHTSPGC
jgi:ankyrin repeat protein